MKILLIIIFILNNLLANSQGFLGNDLTLCEGETAILDASASGASVFLWSTGETIAQISVTTSGIYSVTTGTTGTVNLIMNGTFDNQGTNWSFLGNPTEAYASEVSYGGSNGSNAVAEVDAGDDGIAGTADDMLLSQNIIGLVPGQSYTLCFDYSIRTAGGPNPFSIELDLVGIAQHQIIATNTDWNLQNICFSFTAVATNQVIVLSPLDDSFGGLGMIVDNFVLNIEQGSQSSDEIEVTFISSPNVDAGSDIIICLGDAVTLQGSGNSTSYQWDNGVIDGLPFFPTLTSTYNVVGSIGNCSGSDQITVVVNILPTIDAGENQTICSGSQVILNGSGGNSYNWSGNVIDGVPFTPNSTTTYTLIGEDLNGCTNTDDVIITVNSLPTINPIEDLNICLGQSVTLNASGSGANYSWTGNIINGIEFTPLNTNSYIVTAEDLNGCENSEEVLITVNDPNNSPSLDLGEDVSICFGNFIQLTANGTWNNIIWSTFETNQSIMVGNTGLYWCEVVNSFNCVYRDTIIVQENQSPIITILPFDTISCYPFTVNFEASSSAPNTVFSWNFGDNSNFTSGNILSHTFTSSGVYDLTVNAIADGFCPLQIEIVEAVHVLPKPIASFSNQIISNTENGIDVQFYNNSINYTNLTWSFNQNNISILENPIFEYVNEKNPMATLHVTNGYCSDSITNKIEIPQNLIYYVPNTFTPDGNIFNNIFKPIFTEGFVENSYQLRIYNRWGEILFESNDLNVGWDGTYGSKIAKSDTYFWSIKFIESQGNSIQKIQGHITLLN